MTSQPDSPAVGMRSDAMEADPVQPSDYQTPDTSAARGSSEAADPDSVQDPDLVIVAGEVIEEDADPDIADSSDVAGDLAGDNLADGRGPGDNGRTADVGQQWHDIQALFVDDPRGSVELAAAAADAAVSALVETLRQRQSALGSGGNTSADPDSTEQLREALRGYRIFCRSLTEIGQRLA
jgi:hypothetical protein